MGLYEPRKKHEMFDRDDDDFWLAPDKTMITNAFLCLYPVPPENVTNLIWNFLYFNTGTMYYYSTNKIKENWKLMPNSLNSF